MPELGDFTINKEDNFQERRDMHKTMKKVCIITLIIALVLSTMMMTACGKHIFELTENTGKRMTITAENAEKDIFFMVGSLDVDYGEQSVIHSDLTQGSVRVEIVQAPEGQSADNLPEMDSKVIISADFSSTERTSGTVPEGSYLMQTTCLEKATGTVWIEVLPVS